MADVKEVKFTFVCPDTNKVFESAAFRVVDNRGIVADEAGNKILDAKVALGDPCPFCGKKHLYPAAELPCPFTG